MRSHVLLKKVLAPLRMITALSMLLALFGPFVAVSPVLAAGTRTTSSAVSCTPANPVSLNASVSCTITLTDNQTGTKSSPTGTVSWSVSPSGGSFSGANTCNLASLPASAAQCSVTYSASAVGNFTVSTDWPGDTNHAANTTGSALLTVRRTTTTTVTCSATTIPFSTSVSCTATVADSGGTGASIPTGEVSWVNNGGTISPTSKCTLSNGSCSITFTAGTSMGSGFVRGAYGGSTTHSISSQQVNLTITKHTPAVTVSCTPNPVSAGSATSCNATVTDVNGGPTAFGTVAFTSSGSGAFSPASCTLSGGACSAALSYTSSAGSSGTHTITGTYNPGGDIWHLANTGTFALGVNTPLRATATTVSASPNPVTAGSATTFTASVTDNGPNPSVSPTGKISFAVTDINGNVGTGTLSSPFCTLTGTGNPGSCAALTYTPSEADASLSPLKVSATFEGGSVFATSGANSTFAVQPGQHATTTTLSCTPASASVGSAVTCTAQVVDPSPNPTNPSGSIRFASTGNGTFGQSGTITFDPGPPPSCTLRSISSNKADCSVMYTPSAIDSGTHIITATYPANSSHKTSNGAASITINQNLTGLTLSTVTATYGGTVDLRATLTSNAVGVSGKTLSFSLNGTPVGTATTNPSGLATLPNVSLGGTNAGSYPAGLSVSFAGDSAYDGSTANAALVVNPAAATLTIALSSLSQLYDGAAKSVTVTTTPPGLSGLSITYDGASTTPTNAGSYAVIASLSNPNYTAADAGGTLIIGKATATLTIDPASLNQLYNGSPRPVSPISNPANLSGVTVTYNGATSAPTNAGSYGVAATLNNPNYNPVSVNGTLIISPATASLSLSNLSQIYDGTPKAVSVATSPAGLSGVSLTYNDLATAPTNAGGYAVIAKLTNPNYSAADATGTLVIDKAPATVNLSNLNQVYDGLPKPITVATTPGGLTVNITYDGTTVAPVSVGSYAVAVTVNEANYQGSANATLLIGKATATISFSNLSYTYDGTPKAATVTTNPTGLNLTVSYSLNGNSVANPTNAGSYSVSATLNEAAYQGNATATLLIAKADQTITFAALDDKIYGDGPLTLSATATSGLAVSFAVTGSCSLSANILTLSGAGSCTVTAAQPGNENFISAQEIAHTFRIARATPLLTWDNPASLVYGTALGHDQLNATANLPGSFVYTPAAGTVLPAGDNQSLTVNFTPNDSANYNPVSKTVQISVTKAPALVTWNNPAAIVYGTRLSATQLNATANVAGSFSYTPDLNTALNAGSNQPLMVTFTPTDPANYTSLTKTVTLNVTKAPLTVTATNKSKVYGTANPVFMVIYDGFVLGEDETSLVDNLVCGTGATISSGAGTYSISCFGLTSSNYAITFVNGTLSVTPAPLKVTASDASKVYGANLPAFSVSYSGFVLNETANVLSGRLSFSTAATVSSSIGTYNVTPGGLTSSNYSISFEDGKLEITKAPLLVKAYDQARAYGLDNPALTGTLTGLINHDTITASYTTDATITSPAGTYVITPILTDPAGKLSNYNVTSINGTLTIGKIALTVKANPASKVYGTANPTFTGTLTGVQNGDNITVSYISTAADNSVVGTYPVMPVLADPDSKLSNYLISSSDGTLTITPAALTLTAENKSKTYGANLPAFSVSYRGFVLAETYAVLSGTLTFSTTATGNSPVGVYKVTPGGLTSNNYNISFGDGTLEITKAPLTIKADDKSKMFSAPLPNFTASYNGFVLNETANVLDGTLNCITNANPLSTVGRYSISCAGVSASNYALSFVDGTLTITPYLDSTAPITTAQLSPLPNAAGWNNGNVTVTLSALDEQYGAGVKSISFSASGAQTIASTTVNGNSAIVPLISTEGTTTLSFFAKDNAGNTEISKTVVVKLDKTGPINLSSTPDRAPDNSTGWYNHPVTLKFSGTDTLSGLDSCTSPTYSGPSGSNLTVSGSCTDKAGNVTSGSYKGLKYDATAPNTSARITQGPPPNNSDGWYPYSVNVELQATDDKGGAGVKELTYSALGAGGFSLKTSKNGYASFPITKNGITIINYQSRDEAGNLESVKSLMVKLDNVAPTLTATVSPTRNPAGWNNSNVTVTLDATDSGAGVKVVAYRLNSGAIHSVNGATAAIPVTNEGTTYLTYWATDLAGNGNEGNAKTLVIKLDKSAPAVKSANDGATYKRNQNARASYSCSDLEGSGIASCVGSIPNGSNLDTSSPGPKTYTVTATDKAGNVYVRTITYTVTA